MICMCVSYERMTCLNLRGYKVFLDLVLTTVANTKQQWQINTLQLLLVQSLPGCF